MLYRYSAVDKDGRVLEGDTDADNLDGVFQYLAGQGLRPTSVKKVQEKTLRVRRIFGGIRMSDKIFLTKYLSLMLRVGTDLLSAIDILIQDFDRVSVKNLLLEIRDNLIKGRPFYEVFARYPHVFSLVFVNLVKAAEASGSLQSTFESLSRSLSREAELRGQIRAAITYPVVLLVMAVGIFLFIVTFAVPRVANIFAQSNFEPPVFSRVVFSIGLFVGGHIISAVLILIFGTILGIYFFGFNMFGRKVGDRILRRLPFIRKVYQQLAIQRFAGTFSALLKAGLPIVDALKITADVVGSSEVRVSLIRIADEGLAKGLTIGQAFNRETVFPRIVTNLVAISEKAGHLEESLDTLSEFYSANVNITIKSLMAFLEPVLLLTMGLVVGFVALSMIVPIYQLTTSF